MKTAIAFIALYWTVTLGLARRTRQPSNADAFLMGARNANWLLVAAALFTLVGGGELVTLTSLAFTYGWPSISLFLGYALGFVFLGIVANRLHAEGRAGGLLSLHERAYHRYDIATARLVTLVTLFAFLALLVVQFIAAGTIIAPLVGIPYSVAVVGSAVICVSYLVIGGFDTVLATDLLQAVSRVILAPILLYALSTAASAAGEVQAQAVTSEGAASVFVSLSVTGLFSAAASADVWQRIYAAKSVRAARTGLIAGGIALLLFGVILVFIGNKARILHLTATPDEAFAATASAVSSHWMYLLALFMVLVTILSTADTEIFLVGGMLAREARRFKSKEGSDVLGKRQSLGMLRLGVLLTAAAAVAGALRFANLVAVYTWLISALLVIAPATIGSIFVKRDRAAGTVSIWFSMVAFLSLALTGILKAETAYWVLVPGALSYAIVLVFSRQKEIERT